MTWLRRDAAALAIFLVLTLVMTNPLPFYLASAVEDKQDALLNTWIIAWVGHAIITDPFHLFNANIFFPYPNTLAFSETMLPQAIFVVPFNLAFDNTVLSYNLVLLASFFLAAYAMYLFILDQTRNRSAALVAGTIFAFNPYNLGNLAQVQLLSFGWLPLAMMYFTRVLNLNFQKTNSQIENPRFKASNSKFKIQSLKSDLRTCFLFSFLFSLQALSSFYYAFLAGIAVILYVGWVFVTSHTHHFAYYFLPLKRLALSIVLIAFFITPFFLPYLQVQRELGFERKVEESEPFSASFALYSQVSPQNVLYGKWLAPRPLIYNGGYPLDNLFPGFIALGLAIIGVTAAKNRERWFYFLLLTFAFLLSLGPRFYLSPTQPTVLVLPYRWLYDWFPLMRALRAPVRFDALVMFALAVLAGLRINKIRNSKFEIPIANILILFIAVEYVSFPAAQITFVPVGDTIPAYVRWLAKQPPGVVLELPMIASDTSQALDLTAQYLTTYHWHPTPDGYSGFNPPRRGEIAYEMKFFPSERSISLLQALDVQYLVFHVTPFPEGSWILDAMNHADRLQLAQNFGNDFVYRVALRNPIQYPLEVRWYAPQPAAPSQPYFAYLIAQNYSPNSFAIKPTDTLQVDAQWNEGMMQQVIADLPLVTSSVSVVPVRLSAPRREGTYRLALRVSDRSGTEWNLSGDVNVSTGEAAREVVLPVGVSLRTPLKSEYAHGDSVSVDLTWLPYNKVNAYYSASVRVVNARGEKVIAQDREPRVSTFLWRPGSTVDDQFSLVLPQDITPGEYSVQLLMYQANLGVQALLLDNKFNPQETITLGRFVVK